MIGAGKCSNIKELPYRVHITEIFFGSRFGQNDGIYFAKEGSSIPFHQRIGEKGKEITVGKTNMLLPVFLISIFYHPFGIGPADTGKGSDARQVVFHGPGITVGAGGPVIC